MAAGADTPIEQFLSFPIILSESLHQAILAANSFKLECSDIGKQSERITQMLRSAVRYASSNNSLYDTPVRRIIAQVSKNLNSALTLVHKCRRRNIFRRVFTIVTAADFRRVSNLLDASIGDMKWMLNLFNCDGEGGGGQGIYLSLPPIATNDPILSWVWSFIASIYIGDLDSKINAINELSSVAKDNDRNKKIIVEEGGVPPLIKLLKECDRPDVLMAVANALLILANDQDRVRVIANELGVSVIVSVFGKSPMRVQIVVADLVARMAEYDPVAREEFARENAIRPLVTLVSFETFVDDLQRGNVGKQSIHSIVQMNKQIERNGLSSFSYKPGASNWLHSEGGAAGVFGRRERGNETPEMKLKLKISCSQALMMLARGSVSNSRRITETKGLLCLAKHIEMEKGELQMNCLLTIMEITAAAESDAELRRAAFKTNSPAAKAVVDQLVKLIKDSNNPTLQIPAMRSIASLARTFPARETRVLVPIVEQLGNQNQDVSTEAAISLEKFACPDNFLCVEHTKTIIEYGGVSSLMRLLRGNEIAKFHGVVLLCYLALHVAENEVSEHGRMLTALEGAERTYTALLPEFRELISKAIRRLSVYHSGEISLMVSYAS